MYVGACADEEEDDKQERLEVEERRHLGDLYLSIKKTRLYLDREI